MNVESWAIASAQSSRVHQGPLLVALAFLAFALLALGLLLGSLFFGFLGGSCHLDVVDLAGVGVYHDFPQRLARADHDGVLPSAFFVLELDLADDRAGVFG